MNKEHCLESNCVKCIKKDIYTQIVPPFEFNDKDLNVLLSFFLHRAPNIESIHSKKISREKHASIFELMIEKQHFKYKKFCCFNAVINTELEKAFFSGNNICPKCKRFVCKRKKTNKGHPQETELECFLRHIRNAIAHGRVYCLTINKKKYILMEDLNSTGNISARIVCVKGDLCCWKKILSTESYYV